MSVRQSLVTGSTKEKERGKLFCSHDGVRQRETAESKRNLLNYSAGLIQNLVRLISTFSVINGKSYKLKSLTTA